MRTWRDPGKIGSEYVYSVDKQHSFQCGALISTRSDTSVNITKTSDKYFRTLRHYVTHGIFSKGTGKLEENFARIYTTDSISIGLNHPHASVLRIWDAFEALNDTANETETASFGRSEV